MEEHPESISDPEVLRCVPFGKNKRESSRQEGGLYTGVKRTPIRNRYIYTFCRKANIERTQAGFRNESTLNYTDHLLYVSLYIDGYGNYIAQSWAKRVIALLEYAAEESLYRRFGSKEIKELQNAFGATLGVYQEAVTKYKIHYLKKPFAEVQETFDKFKQTFEAETTPEKPIARSRLEKKRLMNHP